MSTRTLKSLCGKHWWVRSVAFTRAGPADRRQLYTITEVDSTAHYQMSLLYQTLSASAQRPAQGVCVRNRKEGACREAIYIRVSRGKFVWSVCGRAWLCATVEQSIFYFHLQFGRDSRREMIWVWDVWKMWMIENREKKGGNMEREKTKRDINSRATSTLSFFFSIWQTKPHN